MRPGRSNRLERIARRGRWILVSDLVHRLGGYREYRPPPALAAVAEAVWIQRTPASAPPPGAVHRVLPDPALSLALACGRDREGRPVAPRLELIGPRFRPAVFALAPGRELVAVRLKLERVRPLLGIDPSEHANGATDLAAVRPRLARDLLGAVDSARSAEAALVALVAALARAAAPSAREPASAAALDLVRRTRGARSVEAVAGATGMPLRSLRRIAGREAGIGPKRFARTLRLLHAVTQADRSPRPAWARLAARAGYCDQSHLVRECRALCGLTPAAVDCERRAEAETS